MSANQDECGPDPWDPDPKATLECPSSVAWRQSVACTVSANISDFQVNRWRFSGAVDVEERSSSTSWSGPMVVSGTITVEYMLDGVQGQKSAQVTVNRRSGWSWASKVGGRRGSPGEIDECMSPGQAGLVSGQNCSASNPNALFTPARREDPGVFVAAMVSGTGPNGGLWYVQRADVDMQLIAQINRNYRSDGPVHSMVGDPAIVSACVGRFGGAFAQNIQTVNSLCSWEPEFHGLVQFAWDHEQRHLDAALPAARSPSNDLHRLLEPLVAQTEVSLRNAVRTRYDGAQQAIRAAALATHTGTSRTFHFWRFVNGQWGWAATTVFD